MQNLLNERNVRENEKKKFLKGRIFYVREHLKSALKQKKKSKPLEKILLWTERDLIQELLQEKSDILAKKAIVWDIKSFKTRIGWKEEQITQLHCKYWLNMVVDNLNSFIDFCAIHGFIPLIDKIEIEWKDVSEVKDLYTFFSFALFNNDPIVTNILANEIKKLEESTQDASKQILDYIEKISSYIVSTYPYLYWSLWQKENSTWSLSENIFEEVALRIENQLRDKLWIESSYIKPAWYDEDILKKTDMNFIFKRTPNHPYLFIPTQFTIAAGDSELRKEENIEDYLIWALINKDLECPSNFIVLSVNWEFKTKIEDIKWEKKMTRDYTERKENPQKRENWIWKQFPLYINTLDTKIIQPAEVIDVALHLLYKKYDFKYKDNETYLKMMPKDRFLDARAHWEINGIQIDKIEIKWGETVPVKNWNTRRPWLIKHKFPIYYEWEFMWTIVIYALKQQHHQRKQDVNK